MIKIILDATFFMPYDFNDFYNFFNSEQNICVIPWQGICEERKRRDMIKSESTVSWTY
jgi:hypothetical protein